MRPHWPTQTPSPTSFSCIFCTAGTLYPSSRTMVLSRLTSLLGAILISHFNPGTFALDSATGERPKDYRRLISYFMVIDVERIIGTTKLWTCIPESYAGDWNIFSIICLLWKEREGSHLKKGKIFYTYHFVCWQYFMVFKDDFTSNLPFTRAELAIKLSLCGISGIENDLWSRC